MSDMRSIMSMARMNAMPYDGYILVGFAKNCNAQLSVIREQPFDYEAGRCFRAWIFFTLATQSCLFICI